MGIRPGGRTEGRQIVAPLARGPYRAVGGAVGSTRGAARLRRIGDLRTRGGGAEECSGGKIPGAGSGSGNTSAGAEALADRLLDRALAVGAQPILVFFKRGPAERPHHDTASRRSLGARIAAVRDVIELARR